MPRTKFRPCIDIHAGKVKQIVLSALFFLIQVGGTLDTSSLKTNFTSEKPAEYYAQLYREHNLTGAHVVMLGPGCEEAALAALNAWPGTLPLIVADSDGLQVAGGINAENAQLWIQRGATKVVVTSYLFPNAKFSLERLKELETLVGKDRLVVDVRYSLNNKTKDSCRRREGKWLVAMNRWQTITDMEVNQGTLSILQVDKRIVSTVRAALFRVSNSCSGCRGLVSGN
jgi:phosphoribosylformimino-5-aminoimidazole carboxamide ribotide isomerase